MTDLNNGGQLDPNVVDNSVDTGDSGLDAAQTSQTTGTQDPPQAEPAPDATPNQDPAPQDNLVEIEGLGKVTIDELKEWKMGYMRQADYTKKTQEVARQRKEAEQAIQLYEYLRANPHVARKLYEDDDTKPVVDQKTFDPIYQEIEVIKTKMAEKELVQEINELKQKYPDFDEVKVLNEANKRGITDLEFVYKATREATPMDETALAKKIREQIIEDLKKNAANTTTIVGAGDAPPQANTVQLTDAQKRVAQAMGMTEEEYAKWMQK